MFDILSKDSLRKKIEAATNNQCTILYDAYGYPSFMAVIPKFTNGDLFPDSSHVYFASGEDPLFDPDDTYPAFVIKDTTNTTAYEVPEIFISQYRNNLLFTEDTNRYIAESLPGEMFDYEYVFQSPNWKIKNAVSRKGPRWHSMNMWEYYALIYWAYKNNNFICGNTGRSYNEVGTDIYGGKGSISNIYFYKSGGGGNVTIPAGFVVGALIRDSYSGAVARISSINDGIGSLIMICTDLYTDKRFERITGEGGHNCDVELYSDSSQKITGITSIGSDCYNGSGPISWAHNGTTFGVWDLLGGSASRFYGEYLDGIRLSKYNSEIAYQISRTNYVSSDNIDWEWVGFKPAANGNKLLGLQSISGGVPISGGTQDDVIVSNGRYDYGDDSSTYKISTENYSGNEDTTGKALMQLCGMDTPTFNESNNYPYSYTDDDKTNINKAYNAIQVPVGVGSSSSYMRVAYNTNLVESNLTLTTPWCRQWVQAANSTKYAFRSCYIP